MTYSIQRLGTILDNYHDRLQSLEKRIDELHSDSLEDHQEYKKATDQLIKDLRDEIVRYREALFKIMVMTNDPKSILHHISCEALGLDEPNEVYDYDGL